MYQASTNVMCIYDRRKGRGFILNEKNIAINVDNF